VKGVLSHGGEVLLVRHTYGPREWELPGGGLRRRESAHDGIDRELREELGVQIGKATELGQFNGRRQFAHVRVSLFAAELPSRELSIDPVEIAEVAWFDPADPPLPLGWFATEGLARAAKR
jgi:ADP-ribose pyrophosphatase YjhB (NUDIX family)